MALICIFCVQLCLFDVSLDINKRKKCKFRSHDVISNRSVWGNVRNYVKFQKPVFLCRSIPSRCLPPAVHVPLSELQDLWPAATGSARLCLRQNGRGQSRGARDQASLCRRWALRVKTGSFWVLNETWVILSSSSPSSLQVEVTVSLLPPVAASKAAKVVLILSSLVPVSWVVVARRVEGHVTVHVRVPFSLKHLLSF